MPEQNFQNHKNRPVGYLIVFLILMLTLIGAVVNLYHSWEDHQRLYSASLILVLTFCVIALQALARVAALSTQDRAIHAAESLRHYIATGKPLDPRLTLGQVIALRFASDAEYVDLTRRAAGEALAPDDIKRAVKAWRPDTRRV